MIGIKRPSIPPQLAAATAAATQALIDDWNAGRVVKVPLSIYNSQPVKDALRLAQNDKCAYCETQNPTSHDVVEHFRPKGGWRQKRSDALTTPGYFWLSYSWNNLLFACDRCNDAHHKENLFPLQNSAHRANSNTRDTALEKPLLLDPYGRRNPEKHITWDHDVPRGKTPFGRATIATFRLDEDSLLLKCRKEYFSNVETFLAAVEFLPKGHPKRNAARGVFLKSIGPKGPWSAMIKSNYGNRILAL